MTCMSKHEAIAAIKKYAEGLRTRQVRVGTVHFVSPGQGDGALSEASIFRCIDASVTYEAIRYFYNENAHNNIKFLTDPSKDDYSSKAIFVVPM